MMREFLHTLKGITLGLIFAVGVGYVFAWTSAPANPPANNVPAPLNVGSASQTKAGALFVLGEVNAGFFNTDGGGYFGEDVSIGMFPSDNLGRLGVGGKVQILDGTQGDKKVFTSDANGVGSWVTATGGFSNMRVFEIGDSGSSWTVPPGVTKVMIEAWGGGGGGRVYQGSPTTSCAGGGGGAYGKGIYSVAPGNSVSVVVGQGGLSHAPVNNNDTPNPGGDSSASVAGNTLTAGGGGSATLPNGATYLMPGAGGTSNAPFSISGYSGTLGIGVGGPPLGGASPLGGGGALAQGDAVCRVPAKHAAKVPGGGGVAGWGGAGEGSGASGRVVIWW